VTRTERESERDRERDGETERDTQRDRHTHTDRERRKERRWGLICSSRVHQDQGIYKEGEREGLKGR
jgi:hypothetical protein